MVWAICRCSRVKVLFVCNHSTLSEPNLLIFRDLARLHRRKYRGPLEIYVTSGDTIYITDAEKTFTMTSVLVQAEDDSDICEKDSQKSGEPDQQGRRTNRHLERRQLEGSLSYEVSEDSEAKEGAPPLPPTVQVTLTPFGRDLAHFPSDMPKSAVGEHYHGKWTAAVTGDKAECE